VSTVDKFAAQLVSGTIVSPRSFHRMERIVVVAALVEYHWILVKSVLRRRQCQFFFQFSNDATAGHEAPIRAAMLTAVADYRHANRHGQLPANDWSRRQQDGAPVVQRTSTC
jgi:hypothetical protein